MVLESAADQLAFLDTNAHGVNAVVTIAGSASTIQVIFNNEYFEIAEGVGVEGTQPVITCRSIDVTNIDQGDTLVIAATTYTVQNVMPDNTGFTQLVCTD
jgi:hypothetical protein